MTKLKSLVLAIKCTFATSYNKTAGTIQMTSSGAAMFTVITGPNYFCSSQQNFVQRKKKKKWNVCRGNISTSYLFEAEVQLSKKFTVRGFHGKNVS